MTPGCRGGGGGRGGEGCDADPGAGVRSSPLSGRCRCIRISSPAAPAAGWQPDIVKGWDLKVDDCISYFCGPG